ncbi:MAG TPA: choice-of-anchor Q domain-containing protein [Candidatus Dormibacteraeota bacterium]
MSPQGGGIFNLGAHLSLANDTVAGNTAVKDNVGHAPAVGGGIVQVDFGAPTPVSAARTNSRPEGLGVLVPRILAAEAAARTPAAGRSATASRVASAATTSLDFVTLAGNSAELFGGIASLAGRFDVANTIVAGSSGGDCGNPGNVTSAGFNLESANDCGFRQTGDQVSTDPMLDALKVNAPGVTATMALLPGSPAIDAASPRCDQGADQRGVTRPQGPRCDIGAFEVAQPQSAMPASPPSPPVTGLRAVASTHGGQAIVGALLLLILVAASGAGLALRRHRAA